MKEWSKVLYNSIKLPYVRFCVENNISSTHLTLFNHFITLTLGCWGFSRGTHWGLIVGLGVCLLNGFLDYLDGDVARARNESGEFGIWIDSGFDVIIQNAVMGAVAIGCYKTGLPVVWIVLFFISNTANNFVSFNYNQRFGFDSSNGNDIFRQGMDKKQNVINIFFKGMIDPTSNYLALCFYTYRYFLAFGAFFNLMNPCFILMTIIGNIKWMVMFMLYALYLREYKWLHVLKVLSLLDEERDEFFRVRYSQKV